MSIGVALVQLDVSSDAGYDARLAHAHELIAIAAQGADLVVLPELWHVGAFDMEAVQQHAEAWGGPLMQRMGSAAAAYGVWLHAGSFAERTDDGRIYNTSLLIDPQGQVVAHYRKVHLFGFDSGEAAVLTGGHELVVHHTPLGPTGLATCYDVRFPELFRSLGERGAEAFLVTSGWPEARIDQWDVLIRARAIENQSWVIACNEVGRQRTAEGVVTLGGSSQIVSPTGEVLARADASEQILRAEVDASMVRQVRAEFPVLRDVRIHGAALE